MSKSKFKNVLKYPAKGVTETNKDAVGETVDDDNVIQMDADDKKPSRFSKFLSGFKTRKFKMEKDTETQKRNREKAAGFAQQAFRFIKSTLKVALVFIAALLIATIVFSIGFTLVAACVNNLYYAFFVEGTFNALVFYTTFAVMLTALFGPLTIITFIKVYKGLRDFVDKSKTDFDEIGSDKSK